MACESLIGFSITSSIAFTLPIAYGLYWAIIKGSNTPCSKCGHKAHHCKRTCEIVDATRKCTECKHVHGSSAICTRIVPKLDRPFTYGAQVETYNTVTRTRDVMREVDEPVHINVHTTQPATQYAAVRHHNGPNNIYEPLFSKPFTTTEQRISHYVKKTKMVKEPYEVRVPSSYCPKIYGPAVTIQAPCGCAITQKCACTRCACVRCTVLHNLTKNLSDPAAFSPFHAALGFFLIVAILCGGVLGLLAWAGFVPQWHMCSPYVGPWCGGIVVAILLVATACGLWKIHRS